MFDLYLFNTIVNTVWYIFTILFVLYKFTSFFSYIYNFFRFCGKIFTGTRYIYNYFNKNVYRDIESQNTPKSAFQKFRETCNTKWNKFYFKIFGKQQPNIIPKYENVFPLVETTTLQNSSAYSFNTNSPSFNHNNSSSFNHNNSSSFNHTKSSFNPNSILETELFNKKMDELMDDNSHYFDTNYSSFTKDNLHNSNALFESKFIKQNISTNSNYTDIDINADVDDNLVSNSEIEKEPLLTKIVKKIRFDDSVSYSNLQTYSDSDSESETEYKHKILENPYL